MERLTKRQAFTVGGVIYAKCEHCQDKRPECFGEQCPVPDEALISLAAYEDTGLSPADIPALTARAEAAEAERDACKADLQSIVTQSVKDMEKRNWTPPCRYCSKYFVCDYIPEESGCCFEWRGPQAVEGGTP